MKFLYILSFFGILSCATTNDSFHWLNWLKSESIHFLSAVRTLGSDALESLKNRSETENTPGFCSNTARVWKNPLWFHSCRDSGLAAGIWEHWWIIYFLNLRSGLCFEPECELIISVNLDTFHYSLKRSFFSSRSWFLSIWASFLSKHSLLQALLFLLKITFQMQCFWW